MYCIWHWFTLFKRHVNNRQGKVYDHRFRNHFTTVSYFVFTDSLVKSQTATFCSQFDCHPTQCLFQPHIICYFHHYFPFCQLSPSDQSFWLFYDHFCFTMNTFEQKGLMRTMDGLITRWPLTLECSGWPKTQKALQYSIQQGYKTNQCQKKCVQINQFFTWPSGSGRLMGNFSRRTKQAPCALTCPVATYLGILQ